MSPHHRPSPASKRTRIGDHRLRPESLMMGYGYDPSLSEGSVKCPIFQTSTFAFEKAEDGKAFFEVAYGLREKGPGEGLGLIYSRLNNPDLEILEDRLTLWDGAEAAASFQSGMAAIATTLLTYCRPGDLLLHTEPLYGGSDYLVRHYLPLLGVEPVEIPCGLAPDALDELLREKTNGRPVRAALIESPANPTNALVDIGATADAVRRLATKDVTPVVIVDNTFLGPLWQRPLQHGADIVIYSATKFLGGHSDLVAGALTGHEKLVAPVKSLRTILGTAADAWTGWLLLRSLETLKMRMTAQMKNARYVADFLDDHPKVKKVHYLGLLREGDEGYDVYRKQCSGPGSMIAFDVDCGGSGQPDDPEQAARAEAAAFRFLDALELVHLAVSLGGTESLAEHPATMTHSDMTKEEQARFGIGPGMVRISIGVEHYEDIIADVEQALESV